ncbi:MAG: AMP-binding protein [Gammaproteobacteria bacterium]|nr:AMP-binding protein [Gammaproteobacteria bacterium]
MNVADWISGWARQRGARPAIHFEGAVWSYRRLADAVNAGAADLAGRGVQIGDRVALLGYNSPHYLAALFACARLGVIAVPLNWRLAPPEHDYILANSGARLLLASADLAGLAKRLETPGARVLLEGVSPGWERLDWSAGGASAPAVVEAGDTPLLLVYTSGTTGRPKGALLSHRALWVNAVNSAHAHDLISTDQVLTNLPLFHVGGLNIQTLPALHAGAQVTLHRQFDPAATLRDIAAKRPTLFLMVPATMAALINHPEWRSADLSSLRVAMAGASTIPLALIRAFHERAVPVGQIYGATETAPIAAYLRAEDAFAHAGSAGLPTVGGDLRIEAGGEPAAPGVRGEILVRGANLMNGYWQNAAATQEALRDGWFHTGDVGHLDEDGYLFIDDRMGDVIISGGENIYPAELENVLADCAELAEVAVVGRADAKWGQVPMVVAVPRAGSDINEADVRSLFEGKVARFKWPKHVQFKDALPRNAMGKVLKYLLRDDE